MLNQQTIIPEKRYYSIREVSEFCQLEPHVLRYWEQEFAQLSPSKRKGNRRFYQYKDVQLVRKIQKLLYEEGFTIEGARQQLNRNPMLNKAQQHQAEVIKKTIVELEKVNVMLRC